MYYTIYFKHLNKFIMIDNRYEQIFYLVCRSLIIQERWINNNEVYNIVQEDITNVFGESKDVGYIEILNIKESIIDIINFCINILLELGLIKSELSNKEHYISYKWTGMQGFVERYLMESGVLFNEKNKDYFISYNTLEGKIKAFLRNFLNFLIVNCNSAINMEITQTLTENCNLVGYENHIDKTIASLLFLDFIYSDKVSILLNVGLFNHLSVELKHPYNILTETNNRPLYTESDQFTIFHNNVLLNKIDQWRSLIEEVFRKKSEKNYVLSNTYNNQLNMPNEFKQNNKHNLNNFDNNLSPNKLCLNNLKNSNIIKHNYKSDIINRQINNNDLDLNSDFTIGTKRVNYSENNSKNNKILDNNHFNNKIINKNLNNKISNYKSKISNTEIVNSINKSEQISEASLNNKGTNQNTNCIINSNKIVIEKLNCGHEKLRESVSESGFALIKGKDWIYYLKDLMCIVGRSSEKHACRGFISNKSENTLWEVDVNLGQHKKISRQHALIAYNFNEGNFEIKNISKRFSIKVNGMTLKPNEDITLTSKSTISIGNQEFFFFLPLDC